MRMTLAVTAGLWLIGSVLLVAERALDPKQELNVRIWIGVAVGLLGFALAWAGHRMRARESTQS